MAFTFNKTLRLRLRRLFRRRQRQAAAATAAAETHVEKDLIARFGHLGQVKRFTFGWIFLVLLLLFCTGLQTMALSGYYQTLKPVAGGTYNEGVVGTYSNANPIYATGSVDSSVSRLIFAGLLRYDDHNNLVGDLATGYSVDATGKHYIVTLHKGLTWQDGKPLTAEDVVFTFKTIQNPDANSPLLAGWQGITITATDATTVTFDLPSSLSAFPYSLTTGILPQHILGKVPANKLRSANFNTVRPVGAGPFAWQALQQGDSADPAKATTYIALQPFKHYVGGAPKLDGFVVRAYASQDKMVTAYQNREINAMSGLNQVPTSLKNSSDTTIYDFRSTAALMAFFKTSSGVLSDVQVRQALVKGTDTDAILQGLGYPTKPVHEPLLSGQLGYDAKYQQSSYNPIAADAQLTADGWIRGSDGFRTKAGQRLTFHLYTQDTPDNSYVASHLVADWRALGVDASSVSQQAADFQTTLEYHTYDALLYGISIGVDPDVFAYWDSSQADVRAANRVNFSEYKSATADSALEAGRTRTDPLLRVIKYRPFLLAWQTDAPAVGLYQPRILYITRDPVAGLTEHTLNTDTDRYNSVQNWEIHYAKISN